MACTPICKICDHIRVSQAISYASGILTINLPSGTYTNGEKYCIITAQDIPTTAIIGAPVVITIGEGTATYSLVGNNCAQITAGALRNRTRYSTILATDTAGGATFRMIGKPCCTLSTAAESISG